MIDHIWSVACWRGSIDNRTNTVSLFDVLEQINIHQLEKPPANVLPIQFEVVTFWTRSDPDTPAKGKERVSLWFPAGKKLKVQGEVSLDLSGHESFRSIMSITGFPLAGEGRYRIKIDVQIEGEERWRKVAELPIRVVYLPADETPKPGRTKKA